MGEVTKPAVIFDLDGTLIDSAPDIHACLNKTLAQFGQPQITLSQTKSFIGRGVAALVDQALEAVGAALAPSQAGAMVTHLVELYETEIGHSVPYPGMRAALEALRGQGHALAICTNRPQAPTQAMLAHFGLTQLFESCAYGDGPYPRKPDPASLRHVMNELGTQAAIYVGDSETDAATAQASGVPFLLFTEGYRKSPV